MTDPKMLLIMAPLLAIPVVWRIRRDFNFQRIASGRFRLRMILMSLLTVVVTIFLTMAQPLLMALTWAISLSLLGLSLRLTVYESRPDGLWFRTNPWVGGTLILLFLGRMGYRLYQIAGSGALDAMANGDPTGQLGRSPLSWMIALLLLSYHAMYYIMVTRRAAGWSDNSSAGDI
jgi:hypothetical protein